MAEKKLITSITTPIPPPHCFRGRKGAFRKVLLLGSGALKIGEAGEFDYSGSQAAKALREENIETVLINPNIATIQTSHELVKRVYLLPINPYFVEKVIAKENPDGILLGFGGQTALNCGLTLAKKRVFQKYNVEVLGTPVSAIEKTEDRLLFRQSIEKLGLKVPKSVLCRSLAELLKVEKSLTYPVIIRAGFSLGGLGSGMARDNAQLNDIAKKALSLSPQILIEEYLEHWKEIEYEVVRDRFDNTITVCNMENLDPMGIHTGESIVVAPSQTLTNQEFHLLRELSIIIVKSLPIIGECNIQFALNPENGDYRIIEINARLSRSSALASKATGYPLAYIAAKIALGYSLADIPNKVTEATSAFFEPALDYVIVKVPRWDFLKFKNIDDTLGSEMQSVGEVMAIGRTFEEALQKAFRSLDLDYEGIISDELDKKKVSQLTKVKYKDLHPSPNRPYNIAFNLFFGQQSKEIYRQTGIDPWFIQRIKNIVDLYRHMLEVSQKKSISTQLLLQAKKLGFSDQQIGEIFGKTAGTIRSYRKRNNILPFICQIDTLAGEFPAKTNYLYLSYHRSRHDISSGGKKQIAIIGGGPYQIGSSVEFDWCAVNTVLSLKRLGFQPIMINCNPETVSTDYDISDKLYFEELTLERILDILDFEKCPVIVSVGGQIPNRLAPKLSQEKIKLLGNSASVIDQVENREKFSDLLDRLGINQPSWRRLKSKKEAISFSEKIGYPVLLRPSYVLSGRAMYTAYSRNTLLIYLRQADALVNPEYPIVISKFLRGAKEVDFDAVADKGNIVVRAISEHVEHAGVHSGDATLVLPAFSLSKNAIEEINSISDKIAKSLPISGPFNIQFLVNDEANRTPDVFVIEANLRASRSYPFASKVLGVNFIDLATRIVLGKNIDMPKRKKIDYYGVKVSHFSFTRLRSADPVLRVEMVSTGEVACFGDNLYEAYLKALLSTGIQLPHGSALLSLGGEEAKFRLLPAARILQKLGFTIYATEKTYRFLKRNQIACRFVYKVHDSKRPNIVDLINDKKVSLVINISDKSDLGIKEISNMITDGYYIRRAAVDSNIPLFTKTTIANLFVSAMARYKIDMLKVKSWDEYAVK